MTEYGISTERDSSGERKAVDHTYTHNGEEITIKLLPPTISELEEFENYGEDMPASEVSNILQDHIIKPEINDPTIKEAFAYVEGIVDYANNGNELANAASEELEARGGSGN